MLTDEIGSELTDARSLSHFEAVQEAEDLHGILRDLDFTKKAIERLNEIMDLSEGDPGIDDDWIIERSLYTAALIAYARCYGKAGRKASGKRTLLNAEQVFEDADESWKRHHKHFILVRDKHLAHSVNAFEINKAGLFVEDWNSDPPKHSVGILSLHRASETIGNVLALADLAEITAEHVYERQNLLLKRIEEQVDDLPVQAQRSLPPFVLEVRQGPKDVSGPR